MHGWGLDYNAFLPIKNYLKGYKCYFFTLLDEDKECTLYDYVEYLKCVIERESLDNITLIGHSFGGRVALLLAKNNPQVKGLILVDSAGLKPRFSVRKTIKKLDYKIRKRLNLDVTKCGSKDYIVLSNNMKETFKNIVNYHLDGILNEINQDTLIIFGKKDKETPLYMAKRLKKGIKNSALILLNGGHFAYLENFYTFSMIIKNYLDGLYEF